MTISYNKLADLARAAGRSGEAEGLYRQSLQVAEELAALEPGSTTYRRDLSISYERLADLLKRKDAAAAQGFADQAVALRRGAQRLEPTREDIAVQFAYALYLRCQILAESGHSGASADDRQEIATTLAPFESAELLSDRSRTLMRWAQDGGGLTRA